MTELKKAAKESCEAPCESKAVPQIIFTSVPSSFRSGYSDEKECNRLAEQTKKSPLTFGTKSFGSMNELSEWISQFSQGKGAEGEQLYKQCPGSCSPQFHYEIRTGGGVDVTPAVICGAARDKDENLYSIAVSVELQCSRSAS